MPLPNKAFVVLPGSISGSYPGFGAQLSSITFVVLAADNAVVAAGQQNISVPIDYSYNIHDIELKIAAACRENMSDPLLEVVLLWNTGN